MTRAGCTHASQQAAFRHRLRQHVFGLVRRSGTLPFSRILEKSLNCDPALLVDILEELHADKQLRKTEESGLAYTTTEGRRSEVAPSSDTSYGSDGADSSTNDKHRALAVAQEVLGLLPEPSPVYSQWWYAPSSYGAMVDLVLTMHRPMSPIAFVGCSTLGSVFSQLCSSAALLVDLDRALLDALSPTCAHRAELVCADVTRGELPEHGGRYYTVFVDPPWGRRSILQFLESAAALLAQGGRMAISFPQEFTRPSITSERTALLRFSRRLGLKKVGFMRSVTQYAVPEFEHAAYAALGLKLTSPWRRGDMYFFERSGRSQESPKSGPKHKCDWNQFSFGRRRLFLRRDGEEEEGPPKVSPLPGLDAFILPTTSSRHAHWQEASLVSTRNRVARASGRAALAALMDDLSGAEEARCASARDHSFGDDVYLQSCISGMLAEATR